MLFISFTSEFENPATVCEVEQSSPREGRTRYTPSAMKIARTLLGATYDPTVTALRQIRVYRIGPSTSPSPTRLEEEGTSTRGAAKCGKCKNA